MSAEDLVWTGPFILESESPNSRPAGWPASGFFDGAEGAGTPNSFQNFPRADFNIGPTEDGSVPYVDGFHAASPPSQQDFSHVYGTDSESRGTPNHSYNTRLASAYNSERSHGHSQASPLDSPLVHSSEHSAEEVIESDDVRLDRLIATDPKTALKLMKFREIYVKSLLEYAQVLGRIGPGEDPNVARPEFFLEGVQYVGDDSEDPATLMARTTLIEMDKWCQKKEQVDANLQRQKFYELFQNLKRSNNKELRIKIVSGELPITQLVDMDAKDLAPESLKKKRETEAEKYFKQQVILKDDPTASIIIKTHKGIETIAPMPVEKKDDKSERVATPVDSSDTEEEDTSVPWINELGPEGEGDFLSEQQTVEPSLETSTRFSPSLSPAIFAQMNSRPWTCLLSYDSELLASTKMKELPSDPSDALFANQADRLLNRLHWLESQHEARYSASHASSAANVEICGLISGLKRSLVAHAERLESGGWVQSTPSINLPPATSTLR